MKQRFRGHAETLSIVGFGSLSFGLFWAMLLVAKHEEYAFGFKILVFLVPPLVGLLFFLTFIAIVLVFGFAGEWLDGRFAKWRRARKNDK